MEGTTGMLRLLVTSSVGSWYHLKTSRREKPLPKWPL